MYIRKAKIEDASLLLEMMTQFNREESIELSAEVIQNTIAASFSNPNHVQTFLAFENKNVVGYIHVCFSFSFEHQGLEASIDEIFIINDYRRLGLASVIISDIENILISKGIVIIRADVSDDKPWLDDFYKKIGFQQAHYRPYYKRL